MFDIAASQHLCHDKNLFYEFNSLKNERMSVAIDGVTFLIEGKRKFELKFGQRLFHFSNIMHSPKLRNNLISSPKFDIKGVKFTGENGKAKVSKASQHLCTSFLKNSTYHFYPKILCSVPKRVKFKVSCVHKYDFGVWYCRFAPSFRAHRKVLLKMEMSSWLK